MIKKIFSDKKSDDTNKTLRRYRRDTNKTPPIYLTFRTEESSALRNQEEWHREDLEGKTPIGLRNQEEWHREDLEGKTPIGLRKQKERHQWIRPRRKDTNRFEESEGKTPMDST